MNIALIGATGFVGRGLLERMSALVDLELIAAVRRPVSAFPERVTSQVVGRLEADTDWRKLLDGVEVVIHSAARVHVMHDTSSDPLAEFRKVNVEGSLNLARQAAAAGVRRGAEQEGHPHRARRPARRLPAAHATGAGWRRRNRGDACQSRA